MASKLFHRGYEGSVNISTDDEMLHGRVIGIRDTISYGGTTVKTLTKNFRDAVDEYLRFCDETGKAPDTPFKGSFNVRISPALHQRAAAFAAQREMKLNSLMQEALSSYLNEQEDRAA